MRIVLLTLRDARSDVRARALARSLELVGHEVLFVSAGIGDASTEYVDWVPRTIPARGIIQKVKRRLGLAPGNNFEARFVARVSAAQPDLIYALNEPSIEVAEQSATATGAALVRDPRWRTSSPWDIVDLAPHDTKWSRSPAGPGVSFFTDDDHRAPWTPAPGRHAGRRITLVYQQTATTPARYLAAAAERAGLDVTRTSNLDWDTVDADTAAVVFVESPFPASTVQGSNPGIPVLLWIHHGEIHTNAHLRLLRRYAPDALLMAHSWHLAHRFPVPVHRFPFAVPTELVDASNPYVTRANDVAFVGALGEGDRYAQRRQMIASVIEAVGSESFRLEQGIAPEELASVYGDARAVINEGGTRHHPITMRVFEAIGSGATLVTERAPGLDCLFSADRDYVEYDRGSAIEGMRELLGPAGRGRGIAASALDRALGHHTYDHRIDELLEIAAASVASTGRWQAGSSLSPLADAVDTAVEIDSLAIYGSPGLEGELPLRVAWCEPEPGLRGYDAVVVGRDHPFEGSLVDQAARYVVIDPMHGDSLDAWLRGRQGIRKSELSDAIVVDLGTPGYRVQTMETT